MDRKMIAIGLLTVTALALAVWVGQGLAPKEAKAQGGVYSTYLAVTAETRDDNAQFVVLDTSQRRLIMYTYNVSEKQLVPADGRKLVDDFRRPAGSL